MAFRREDFFLGGLTTSPWVPLNGEETFGAPIAMGISLEITMGVSLEITMESQPGDYYGESAWRLLCLLLVHILGLEPMDILCLLLVHTLGLEPMGSST